MHILVVNDDGPPSNQSSPYVFSLVSTLQNAGHTVSVILPHIQRSWIGKAHFVGELAKATYYHPDGSNGESGSTHTGPPSDEDWVLINGTPATCTQLGLFHFFQDRGPVDLVLSGPNYGRNVTSLFSLASGTIGGAMEAAQLQRKAIALSYAFDAPEHDPELIASASRLSVKVIEKLMSKWEKAVDLYTINVPLVAGIENHKVVFTRVLPNYWETGSSFEEVESDQALDAATHEQDIREHGGDRSKIAEGSSQAQLATRQRHFKWAPKLKEVIRSAEESSVGNDGWALGQGYTRQVEVSEEDSTNHTSITPLKANFMHVIPQQEGELMLDHDSSSTTTQGIYAQITYEDTYIQPLIRDALQNCLGSSLVEISSLDNLPYPEAPLLQISSYESLSLDHLLANPSSHLANSYIIRKALIRKHYLASTISSFITKHPDSILAAHTIPTVAFELDYAEFLDDALIEAFELHESFARNAVLENPVDREWWILKPSMSERGQGIKLFSSEAELQGIFEAWEAEYPEAESESESEHEIESESIYEVGAIDSQSSTSITQIDQGGIITSQLRHFVAQPYINPLLFHEHGNRKFHIRCYVLAVGALKVYVYRGMLALFSSKPYISPGSDRSYFPSTDADTSKADTADDIATVVHMDMQSHLTNTCLQNGTRAGTVLRFWDLPADLPSPIAPPPLASLSPKAAPAASPDWRTHTFDTIAACTAALFSAAASNPTTFQPLPNAFEVYGVDWMVDSSGRAWLLEVNAFPDMAQTGEQLMGVVAGFWDGVVREAVAPFWGLRVDERDGRDEGSLRLVLDLDMGRL